MNAMEGQMNIFDQDIWSGKMSVAHCQAENQEERTSELSWKSWLGLSKKTSLFLDLRKESGATPESLLGRTTQLRGESQTVNGGVSRNVEEGLRSLLTSQDTMHLAWFLAKANTTEAPCEIIPSHLSDILEENPDPKYNLSSKACLGILNRAMRRGKTLPPMLEEALIQTVVGETEYGQKGITDTIEILREMRCEIGEEALKEWVQRAFVLVQSEKVLLGEMCESVEDSEDSNERVLVEGDSEESNREEGLCDLRSIGEVGDTPQRQEPNEQLRGELDLLMQKLPHENAQKAVIMYCLRIACEGEESVSETLSTVLEGKSLGVDIYNTEITGDTVCPLTAGGYTSTGTCPKVMVTVYSVDQGGGKSACNVTEGQSPTLTCTHGGEPVVCYERPHRIVRRLTPLECERLQGYPDGWTDIGDWTDSNGKVHKTSDAARYKALGNSIALPPWKWVLKRLCACYERDATMASLFDGIGGFPYLWEQLNGKGSCLWASEIEEFPIAVTKLRIGGD